MRLRRREIWEGIVVLQTVKTRDIRETVILNPLLCFMSFVCFGVSAFADDHVTHWQRYPFLGIPLVEKAPAIDGTVDTREWFAAARVGYLLDARTGLAANEPSSFYLCYSATH